MVVYLLDYGAGNVRSLVNAVKKIGYEIEPITCVEDFDKANKIIFPGVGAFGPAMEKLREKGFYEPLKKYIASGKPFMGICVGMQSLCLGSEENPGVEGLCIIPTTVRRFNDKTKTVPHMGWNGAHLEKEQSQDKNSLSSIQLINHRGEEDSFYYFVHSYAIPYTEDIKDWVLSTTTYKDEKYVSSIQKGNIFATQFHPEKSGYAGLMILKSFLDFGEEGKTVSTNVVAPLSTPCRDRLTRRIIACLDVRTNDQGDLVVTKGDQYDVREKKDGNNVRNLGKPVDLAKRYYEEGADEITFLNITSFRDCPLRDLPMIEVLKRASESIFVPLTIGGGIRDLTDPDGVFHPALEVAGEYFRSGADKVSIGSDAVYATEQFIARGNKPSGDTAIEQISKVYGAQAVVISVDPRRVYVKSPEDAPNHHVLPTKYPGPNGENYCWYQCTVKGGREGRDVDVYQLVTSCEAMGAGEILCNCMDKDGTNSGFDLELIADVKKAVTIPVIASSGAGKPEHFTEVFEATDVEAALAAGIFHRREVPIVSVKEHLFKTNVPVRPVEKEITKTVN